MRRSPGVLIALALRLRDQVLAAEAGVVLDHVGDHSRAALRVPDLLAAAEDQVGPGAAQVLVGDHPLVVAIVVVGGEPGQGGVGDVVVGDDRGRLALVVGDLEQGLERPPVRADADVVALRLHPGRHRGCSSRRVGGDPAALGVGAQHPEVVEIVHRLAHRLAVEAVLDRGPLDRAHPVADQDDDARPLCGPGAGGARCRAGREQGGGRDRGDAGGGEQATGAGPGRVAVNGRSRLNCSTMRLSKTYHAGTRACRPAH